MTSSTKRRAEDYIIRFAFEITEEQQNRTNKLLGAYGLRRRVFSIILDDLLDLIEEEGQVALGILISGTLKPRELLPLMSKSCREAKKINEK